MKKIFLLIFTLSVLLASCAGTTPVQTEQPQTTDTAAIVTQEEPALVQAEETPATEPVAEQTEETTVQDTSAQETVAQETTSLPEETPTPIRAIATPARPGTTRPPEQPQPQVQEVEQPVAQELVQEPQQVIEQIPDAEQVAREPTQPVMQVPPQVEQPPTQPPTQTPPVQQPPQTPPRQPTPPQPAQPPAQPPTQPTQPPAQVAQPQPEETSPQDETEESAEVVEEPPRRIEQIDFPQGQPSRLDSVSAMGTTPQDSPLIFSRIVRATVGQILEVPFRGNGWVFLGEIASRRGITYNSRRNELEGQSFVFMLEAPGTYVLRFYRQDFIRDYILNDHVQVIVGDAPSAGAGWFNPPVDRGRVVAQPRWPSAGEEAQIRSGTRSSVEPVVTTSETARTTAATTPAQPTAPSSERQPTATQPVATPNVVQPSTATEDRPIVIVPNPVLQPQPPTQEPQRAESAIAAAPSSVPQTALQATPQTGAQTDTQASLPRQIASREEIIQRARESFESADVSEAIALLDQYMAHYPGEITDEILWLLGQFYEANSPSRNILRSLEYYRRLTNEYPQSRRFNDARRRIAYLERFYINIQ